MLNIYRLPTIDLELQLTDSEIIKQQKHITNSDVKKLLKEGQATSLALLSLQESYSQNSLNQI